MTPVIAASLPTRSRFALLLIALSLPLAACSSPSTVATTAPAATAASSVPATSASPTVAATSASPSPSATSASPTPTKAPGYTMADVKKHADAKSCWSVVDGNVYDLTKWVSRHPGGRARILGMCGTDGSKTFHGEHRKEAEPAKILGGYKLGKLA